jgi:hypothetical protein
MSDLGAFWIALGLALFGSCFENGLKSLAEAVNKEYENDN